MKIDWETIRLIVKIFFLSIIAFSSITLCLGVLFAILVVGDTPVTTKHINAQYYFEQESSGWAFTSTVTNIDIYKKRKWLPDKKVGKICKYVTGKEDIHLSFKDNRLIMNVNGEVKVDTLTELDGNFYIDCDQWLEIERSKR